MKIVVAVAPVAVVAAAVAAAVAAKKETINMIRKKL